MVRKKDKNKRLSIFFATFSPWQNGKRQPTNGMIEPMVYYFKPRTEAFVMLDEPHPGSDRVLPIIETHVGQGKPKIEHSSVIIKILYPLLLLRNSEGTRIPFKIRDFLAIVDYFLTHRQKFDFFIGLESVNALAGVLMRRLRFVKKVVYYVSDYSPQRYHNSLFNSVYLWLDRQAAQRADFVWDVSLAMMPARLKGGLNPTKAAPVIHVPNALFPSQINYLPISKIIPYSLVFAGTLGPENGPDLSIMAMPEVSRIFPEARLHIYGGGDANLARLKALVDQLSLQKIVIFHGFFYDQIKLSQQIRHYAIGLATYKAIPGSPRWWADATKIRLYLAAGLPTITTQVPPLGAELTMSGAGVVVDDQPKLIAKAIIDLFNNPRQYRQMRTLAIQKAKDNTWDNTYQQAITKMSLDFN